MTTQAILDRLRADFGPKEVLDADDLAQLLGKSTEATNTLIRRGGLPLPVLRVGGRNCVSAQAVAVWLAGECLEKSPAGIAAPGEAPSLPPPSRKRPNIAAALLCLMTQREFLHEVFARLEEIQITQAEDD